MIDLDKVIVTFKDVRAVVPNGGCRVGFQTFAQQTGIDFKEAVKHGLPASRVLEIDDFRAKQAVEHALARLEKENG